MRLGFSLTALEAFGTNEFSRMRKESKNENIKDNMLKWKLQRRFTFF